MDEIIKVNDFTKKYGKLTAAKNISFTVKKGEIVGFVGKNGAGKSTTIRCMTNMLFPTQGDIKIKGLDSVKDAKKINSLVSYMPSETELYEGVTSKELFKLVLSFDGKKMSYAEELSQYFELNMNKKIQELSLGNRKKVSIIIMFLRNAEIMILDEPTSGLDPLMQKKFFDKIHEKTKNGTTVFLSSHNLNEVEKYCDRAIIIKDGTIVDDLNMAEVNVAKIQNVTYMTSDGKSETYEYEGDINELIGELSKMNLSHLEIKGKSVEEEFIRYYKEGEIHE
ncbi:MAG TPA: ABC transporter ATP-binding protein [Anaerovoracaceae bacterium]|nr:ABC transporter ATP-binding protein [Anaerovoracaceae bacterium]